MIAFCASTSKTDSCSRVKSNSLPIVSELADGGLLVGVIGVGGAEDAKLGVRFAKADDDALMAWQAPSKAGTSHALAHLFLRKVRTHSRTKTVTIRVQRTRSCVEGVYCYCSDASTTASR